MKIVFFVFLLCGLFSVHSLHVSPTQSVVSVTGRTKETSDGCIQFDWSGVGVSIEFSGGEKLSSLLGDFGNLYRITISSGGDEKVKVLETKNTSGVVTEYDLEGKLFPSKTYRVTIVKRTEASLGIVKFCGWNVEGNVSLIDSHRLMKYNFEFVGDSLTCGYGNEGTPPCNFSPETENVCKSFPLLAADAMNASASVICWSGRGLVRNYGWPNITAPDPMPVFYNRTLANIPLGDWKGGDLDAIIMLLGANDFSTPPTPPSELWTERLYLFLDVLRQSNGKNTHIITACGPVPTERCGLVEDDTKKWAEMRGDTRVSFVSLHVLDPSKESEYGCNSHPSVKGDILMSEPLIEHLRGVLPPRL